MENDSTKPLSKVIRIDESEIRGHLDEMVRGTVEETLNALLDAEADEMCKAQRYERSPDRVDTRAGSYTRKQAKGSRRLLHNTLMVYILSISGPQCSAQNYQHTFSQIARHKAQWAGIPFLPVTA